MSGNQALIKLHTISGARGLTDPKLIITCVKKALVIDLSPPAASSSEITRGVPLLASGERGLIVNTPLVNKILLLYRILVTLSTMWSQLLRRQVAYGYMGCGGSGMCNLDTNFLVG